MFSILTVFLLLVFMTYAWWRILTKMGILGWLRFGLTAGVFVPGVGLPLVLLYLGFVKWPVHEEMEKLEKKNRYLATRKFPSIPQNQQQMKQTE